ncbi:MAG TPA: alpha/beta hydrolase [Verrucomicrobiales bacterium]|nr:alpha/beta hydrolase [Verrucomicrobiales bacterium]
MKRALRIAARALLLLLVAGGLAGLVARWILSRPAPSLQVPPVGYGSVNQLKAAYLLGALKLIDRAPPVPPGIQAETGIEYGRVDGKPLLLDLFTPEGLTRPAPLLLFVHGGGWKSGKREDYLVYTTHFAQRGYVTASLSYRLVPKAGFPAPVEDAKCAVRWARENAARLHVDPDRIAILGGSAGGHIALMVGYAQDRPEWEGSGGHPNVSSRVAAVVNFYGPVDLTTPFAQGAGVVRDFLGGKSFQEAPGLYQAASPITYLTSNAPPTLTFHGTLDEIVPIDQADELESRLTALRVPHEYARLEGWPHTMDVALPVNQYAKLRVEAFLRERLGPPPAVDAPPAPATRSSP